MDIKKRSKKANGEITEGEKEYERVFDVQRFYADLDRVRRSRRMPWNAVSRATGVAAGLFSRMGLDGRGCNVSAFLSLLEWSGLNASDYAAKKEEGR